jgi:DNA-binding PadR family transcriptional regulator
MEETGLPSGTLYPILRRLTERGLLSSTWEAPVVEGRPARHLYRLTADGRATAAGTGSPPGVRVRFA